MPSRLPRMWGKRADSSDVGLADFASFYCILVPIKKLCVDRHPSPLPVGPSPPPAIGRGGVRARTPEPGSSEGPSGPPPPAGLPGPRPSPPPPPNRRRFGLLVSKTTAAAPPAPRSAAARAARAGLGPAALGPARSCGERRAEHQGGIAGTAVRTPGVPAPLRPGGNPRTPASAAPRTGKAALASLLLGPGLSLGQARRTRPKR